MVCPKCGFGNSDESLQCGKCGQVLKTATPASSSSDPISTIIPYKNKRALIAYYLGVFSVIPCVGSPLGIAAFILGIQGLMYVKNIPNPREPHMHGWASLWEEFSV